MSDNDDIVDGVLSRHPIFLSDQTVLLMSIFTTPGQKIADMWLWDHHDPRKENKNAARQLIAQISDICSTDFLWALREAAAEEIERGNAECLPHGRTIPHPIDRPEDGAALVAQRTEQQPSKLTDAGSTPAECSPLPALFTGGEL